MTTPRKTCTWRENQDGEWDSTCGRFTAIAEGTPHENEWAWCCYCGGRLREVEYRDDLTVTGEDR